MMKQFLMTAAILVGTVGVANAQVTVAGSNTVDSSTSSNGDHSYSESQKTIQKDEHGGTAVTNESVSHNQETKVVDDSGKEVVPTGAFQSKDIHRTESGRVVIEKD